MYKIAKTQLKFCVSLRNDTQQFCDSVQFANERAMRRKPNSSALHTASLREDNIELSKE